MGHTAYLNYSYYCNQYIAAKPLTMNVRLPILLLAGIFLLGSCDTTKKAARRKAYMERIYNAFKININDADVTFMHDTVKVIFKTPVLFAFGEATIIPQMHPVFERMAKVLLDHPKTEILVVGHTDSIGGNHIRNQELSLRRADSAVNLLSYYKVSRKRMDTRGLGVKEPIASNRTEDGRARNRRVEFVVLYNYDKSTKPKD
jgi:outer membrane protein OmpA-like peptidoglycan-associated protein